jgi:hypothetical protein
MSYRKGNVVKTLASVRPERYANRQGIVASVTRVNPRTHTVIVGMKSVTRNVKGAIREFLVPVIEEQALAPDIEIGVDFASEQAKGELQVHAWFKERELEPVVATTNRPLQRKKGK